MPETTSCTITEGSGDEEATKAAWAKCSECGHCWPAAYYPMTLEKFARIMQKHSDCPKCGGRGMIAKQADGVLKETV